MIRLEAPARLMQALDPDALRLLEAAHDLAAARGLAEVTEAVRRAARDLSGADGVTFVLREGDHVFYADEDAIAPLWKGCRFPAEACISGWAMIHRSSVVIEDITRDPRIPLDLYRPTFVRSLAMVPVGQGEPVAAIGAYWAQRRRATEREMQLLETLAGFAALALANEALVRDLRQSLQARDEFLLVAAHELRTPVAALGLSLDLALKGRDRSSPDGGERLWRALRRARAQVQRLGRLVDVLLDASRGFHPRPRLVRRRVDLARLAEEVVERLRAGSRLPLELQAEGPLVGAWDRLRLEQVLENLVANAVKFGGSRPVEVRVARDGDAARLEVVDHGIGIPSRDQERVFGKFERAVSTRNYGGFGLGLWIVRQNVEAHGGSVRLDSRPGEGTTITVVLPLQGEPDGG